MKYDPTKHHRRSIRVKGYDYASPGAYFVTICVQNRECLLGEVVDGEMRLNAYGSIADEFWREIPIHFPNVSVDAHVTMPNHIHAIITIHARTAGRGAVAAPHHAETQGGETQGGETQGGETPPLRTTSTVARPALGQIVAYYKYQTTKTINRMRDATGTRLWQRNYWEHIVRNEAAYQRVYRYVENNPAHWEDDQLHPDAASR